MIDREVIEQLVDFLVDQGLYTSFVDYMTAKGYDVVGTDESDYITITD